MCHVNNNKILYLWERGQITDILAKLEIKQGRSSSIGAKILSFVFRQLTEDFKEENTEKESIQYGIPISYSPE